MKYKTRLCLLALAGGALSLVFFLYGQREQEPLQYLNRPESGTGDQRMEVRVGMEGETWPFQVTIREIPYEEAEILKKLQSASERLGAVFLKENTDFEHIGQEVSMPSVFPDTEIGIQWYLDSWDHIDPDGTVKNESLKQPVTVRVQAVLTLGEEELVWEQSIQVIPPAHPDAQQKLRMLEYELSERQEEVSDRLELPVFVAGEPIVWYQAADDRWIWMLGLTLLALAAMAAGRRREEDTIRKKRERGMQLDYPEIVSRLSLYMGAGISTRKAWERIVDDYEKNETADVTRHTAYEEMRTTLREMQSGVAETQAYERFGTRCRMPSYLKLGTLLSQNLRKGTKNLAGLLQEESREAFENRRALAKRMGEECESKLLLPMLMMLLTILIIIMYPAVVSFQV